jgi:hypothetical protein
MTEYKPLNIKQNEAANNAILQSVTNAICYTLPVEIWRQIFEECVAHIPRALTPLSWSFNVPEKRTHPYANVAISHVCRHFRHIALSTQVLWSTLNLDGSESEVETFLKRSEQLPLTITSIKDAFHKSLSRHSHTVAAIVGRIVNIDTPTQGINFDAIILCKNLKHVMLRGTQHSDRQLHIESVLNEFESLETLWWRNALGDPITFSSQKNYPLRSLLLSFRMSSVCILSVLQCCPALENVTVDVQGTIDAHNAERIRLPRLRDFRVRFSEEDSWVCKLEVPSVLDHLEFGYYLPHPQSGSQEWTMGARSLVLGDYLDLASMVSWLSREPGVLETLTLRIKYLTDQKRILQVLKADSSRLLCSKLEQVHIWFSHSFDQLSRPVGYTKNDYEELFQDISSSRVQVGLPPVRFIWNGEVVMPKEEVAHEPAVKGNSIEDPNLHPLPEERQSALGGITNASPVSKGIEWARGKLKKPKSFK